MQTLAMACFPLINTSFYFHRKHSCKPKEAFIKALLMEVWCYPLSESCVTYPRWGVYSGMGGMQTCASGQRVHTQVWRSLREDAHSCSCKNKKRSLCAEEVEPRQWVEADSCESTVNSSTTLSFSRIGFGQSMMQRVRKTGFRSEMTGIMRLSKGQNQQPVASVNLRTRKQILTGGSSISGYVTAWELFSDSQVVEKDHKIINIGLKSLRRRILCFYSQSPIGHIVTSVLYFPVNTCGIKRAHPQQWHKHFPCLHSAHHPVFTISNMRASC